MRNSRIVLLALAALLACSVASAAEPIDWTFSVEERLTKLEERVAALEKKNCPCGPDCPCPAGVCPDCPKSDAKPAKGGHWNCGPGGCQWIPDRPSVPADAPQKPAGEGWMYDASLRERNPACTGWYREAPAMSAPMMPRPMTAPAIAPSYSAPRAVPCPTCPGGVRWVN